MTTLLLHVTEVQFDFDDLDFTPEEQQSVVDSVLGNTYQVEVDNENDDGEVADALVEEVTYATGWVVDSVLGNTYQVEVDNENDDGEVADALVEVVTDATGWCVVSLDYRQVTN